MATWLGADWMSRLPSPLTQLPLTRLAMPGSHDSGADTSLDVSFPVANDESSVIRRIGRLKVFSPFK